MGLDNLRERHIEAQEKLSSSQVIIAEKSREIHEVRLELQDVNRKLSKVKRELADAASSPRELGYKEIESLAPSSELAGRLREMVLERRGPWSPESGEEERLVSVVGYLKGNQSAACADTGYRDLRVESVSLISLVSRDGDYFRSAEPIAITQWQGISSIECDRNSSKFDLQISCELAAQIFTAKVVTCNKEGEPAWQNGFTNLLPVGAVAKYREDGK